MRVQVGEGAKELAPLHPLRQPKPSGSDTVVGLQRPQATLPPLHPSVDAAPPHYAMRSSTMGERQALGFVGPTEAPPGPSNAKHI